MRVIRLIWALVVVGSASPAAFGQRIEVGAAELGVEPALQFERIRLEPILAEREDGTIGTRLMISMEVRSRASLDAGSRAIGIEVRTESGASKQYVTFDLAEIPRPGKRIDVRQVIGDPDDIASTDEVTVRERATLAREPASSSRVPLAANSDVLCDTHCNICQDRAEDLCLDGVEWWTCGCNPNTCKFKCVIPRL